MAGVFDTARTAALFPGQGSQTPGMGDLVLAARPDLHSQLLAELGADAFERVAESTRFAQPAIFCASLVGWERLRRLGVEPVAVAGHSLGELTALVAAGVLAEGDGLRLAVRRGALMAEAGEAAGGGGMLAVVGATATQARRIAARHELVVANDNAPGQQVLSGAVEGVRAARRTAKDEGLRAMELDVAGAFHSPQMAAAEAGLRAALADVQLRPPAIPVLSCTSAAPFADVRAELAAALTAPVRWRETLQALDRMGACHFVDVGPGRVLARLVPRTLPNATAGPVEVADALA